MNSKALLRIHRNYQGVLGILRNSYEFLGFIKNTTKYLEFLGLNRRYFPCQGPPQAWSWTRVCALRLLVLAPRLGLACGLGFGNS